MQHTVNIPYIEGLLIVLHAKNWVVCIFASTLHIYVFTRILFIIIFIYKNKELFKFKDTMKLCNTYLILI
jgi:hypothetical protein